MARVNIEDGIESRPEYRRLHKLVGYDDDKALGMLVRFWRLAQKYWGDYKLVPLEEIENWELQPIIESRWGLTREGGVYAVGSEEQFAWYRQKCDAAKKGGRPKKEPSHPEESDDREEPGQNENNRVETGQTGTQLSFDSANPLTLSPAPALSQIQIQDTLLRNVSVKDAQLPELTPKRSKFSDSTRQKMRAFIAAYSSGYKEKYKGPPEGVRNKALIGKIGDWIEHVSEVRAISLVEVYLQISYRPFDEGYHDLWLFFRHLNRIGVALDSGKEPGSTDWEKVFSGGAA